jgi:hypothetical protein
METNKEESIAITIRENIGSLVLEDPETTSSPTLWGAAPAEFHMDNEIFSTKSIGPIVKGDDITVGIEGLIQSAGSIQDMDEFRGDNETEFNHFYKKPESRINVFDFNDMYVKSNSPIASNCNSDIEMDTIGSQENDSPFTRKLLRRQDSRIVQTHKFVSEDEEPQPLYFKFKLDETNQPQFDEPFISNQYELQNTSPKHPIHEPTMNKKYKKFTYQDIEKSLSQYHQKTEPNFNENDLLITYLSGMRAIYMISMNITKVKSFSISMSAISIALYLTIITPFVKDLNWGVYLISGGNAFVAMLIFVLRYFKFESNSAQYAFIAKQFNKLESKVDFENARNVGISSSQKTHEFESSIMEINGYIQEFIPSEVIQLFPLIYRTNIIKFMRQIDTYRKNLIIRFRDIKNEIHYILYKWNSVGERMDSNAQTKNPQQEREKNRVIFLMDLKEKTKKELMQYNTIYIQINDLFKKEIRYAETHHGCFGFPRFFKPDYDFNNLNPIVRDYLKLVIPE